jgi:putative transposase
MPQSLAKVYIHAVFSTKNREPVLDDPWRNDLLHAMESEANSIGCPSLAAGGMADHVHLLFQLERTIAIAEAVGKIKSASSVWVHQRHPLPAPFHWQNGYAAFSASQSTVEEVREYIRRQPEYHTRQSFQDELREWLRRYEVSWDERFVWD